MTQHKKSIRVLPDRHRHSTCSVTPHVLKYRALLLFLLLSLSLSLSPTPSQVPDLVTLNYLPTNNTFVDALTNTTNTTLGMSTTVSSVRFPLFFFFFFGLFQLLNL
jgi:hypothetical protein